jgi:short-subunit dehydrogenase
VAKLALLARRLPELQQARDKLLAAHPRMQIFTESVDMCQRQQVAQAADKLAELMGPIDLVIQAVGKSDRGRLTHLQPETLRELVELNVLSSLHAVQLFPNRLRQPGGTLVLIGSLASLFAPRFLGGYAIAKHALAGLAQQARLELAEDGIHVLLACPGPIARHDAGERYRSRAEAETLPAPPPDAIVRRADRATYPCHS